MKHSIAIKAPEMYAAEESLRFLGRSSDECLFFVEKEMVKRPFRFDGISFLADIDLGSNKVVKAEIQQKGLPGEAIDLVGRYLVDWLGFYNDLEAFYEMAAFDPVLKPLVKKYRGLRVIGIPDLFEALCWAIIGQQINLPFAYTIKRRFVERFGRQLLSGDQLYYHFPEPETVAGISKEELQGLKFSRQKATYMVNLAKQFSEGRLLESELKEMEYGRAKSKLVGIKGIGNWSADYVLMKTLKHPQAFPVQDAGLLNALKKQLGLVSKPKAAEVERLSKAWKGHEALATFYLWRSLMD